MMYEPYIELAEKLAALAPGSFDKQVLFLNSGAEAVENAVKSLVNIQKDLVLSHFLKDSTGVH